MSSLIKGAFSLFGNASQKEEMDVEEKKPEKKEKVVIFNPKMYGEHLSRGFQELYKTGEFTDLVLIAGNEKIRCHKVVLCSWSETFRLMFEGQNWKESHMNELKVAVEEQDLPFFKKMISYMYCESITCHIDDMVNLLALSNYYGVFTLKEACGSVLAESLDEDSAFYLLDVVNQYSVNTLNEACGKFLAKNFGTMLKTDKLLPISVGTWVEMLKSDELEVHSEEDVLSAVIRYAQQFDYDKRVDTLNQCLPHIRWTMLSPKYLVKEVENNPVFKGISGLDEILYETFKVKVCPKTTSSLINTKSRKGKFKFTSDNSDPSIKISEDGLIATNKKTTQGWTTVFCTPEMQSGYFYIEISVKFMNYLMIGVSTDSTAYQLNTYPSQTATGWSWYSAGQLYHAAAATQSGITFVSGSSIGMLLNFDEGFIQFYKDGSTGPKTSVNTGDAMKFWVSFYSMNDSAKIRPVSKPEDLPVSEVSNKKKKGRKNRF